MIMKFNHLHLRLLVQSICFFSDTTKVNPKLGTIIIKILTYVNIMPI